jgi:hypothetical protein
MQRVLIAAAIYNAVWGGFAILFPNVMFDWLGMQRPTYPQFWQCIGMIVGVYGVGYFIAAFNPVRFWPMVLVGFLGKVLGPLGMAWSLWTGQLPWSFAINIVFNDLIWWVPFALILRHAWNQSIRSSACEVLPSEEELLKEAVTQQGPSVAELSSGRDVLLVMLRHTGCTFCREAISDIAAQRSSLAASGIQPVLVHMSSEKDFAVFAARYGMEDVPAVSDPDRRLYRGLGLKRGTLSQLFGPKVWWRGLKAAMQGHGIGALAGDGLQMPGAFRVRDGKIKVRYIHSSAADRPDYTDLQGPEADLAALQASMGAGGRVCC